MRALRNHDYRDRQPESRNCICHLGSCRQSREQFLPCVAVRGNRRRRWNGNRRFRRRACALCNQHETYSICDFNTAAASIPARNLWSQSDLPAICVPAISLVAGVRFAPHISYVRVLGPVHWGTGLLLFKS